MIRSEALEDYKQAVRQGQKYYHDCILQGTFPYPQVLDELMDESATAGRVELGTMDIPMDRIIGTLAAGRKAAFAGNFMPLLGLDSEFAAKWVALCSAHLGETGITDPITVLEYMGRFYVQEGHKRVSVLRFFGAPTIRATVTRIIPAWSEDPGVKAYYEFMDFYKKSELYHVYFTKPGCFPRLQAALGFEPDYVWTEQDRMDFVSFFWGISGLFSGQLAGIRGLTVSEVVLAYVEVYNWRENITEAEKRKRLTAILPDLRFLADNEPSSVSTEPEKQEKSAISRLLDGMTRSQLRIAFIHASSPETSSWSRGHEQGRLHLEEVLAGRVQTRSYVADMENPDAVMQQAVTDGAQVLMATAPTLLAASRRMAALHPQVKVLVCALSVPYAGIRTYYSRIYEAKFITGAIAGAMWNGGNIGYISRYPILGEVAAINAFALGVRMTAPDVNVHLAWSSMAGDPKKELVEKRCRIISGQETNVMDTDRKGAGMSMIQQQPNGEFLPVASACWDWGRLYEQMIQSMLNGAWDVSDPSHSSAVNYWWGMNSGVIDVIYPDTLPAGVKQLADILKNDLKNGAIQVFRCVMKDQEGRVRNDGEKWMNPEDIMRMNWFLDSVIGRIPTVDELMPMARETTKLLGVDMSEDMA